VVQQSVQPLLESGRLAFELKVGQGAKPGLGGMTVLDAATATRLADMFTIDPVFGGGSTRVLRCSSPGTFTGEILRQQIRLTSALGKYHVGLLGPQDVWSDAGAIRSPAV